MACIELGWLYNLFSYPDTKLVSEKMIINSKPAETD